MRKKRLAALLLAALAALSLAGCGANDDQKESEPADMTIRPVQFTQEEVALTELLGLDMGAYRIYDYQAEGVKSIRVAAYELADGDWRAVTIGLGTFESDGAGRIALSFGKMTEGVSVRFQGANGGGGTRFSMPAQEGESGLTFATSVQTNPTGVELDVEIPLALQFATAKSEFSTYDTAYFGMPRELAKQGYEHVYAITVTFSQKPVSELSQDAPGPDGSPLPSDASQAGPAPSAEA